MTAKTKRRIHLSQAYLPHALLLFDLLYLALMGKGKPGRIVGLNLRLSLKALSSCPLTGAFFAMATQTITAISVGIKGNLGFYLITPAAEFHPLTPFIHDIRYKLTLYERITRCSCKASIV